ncbi:MAG: cell division ATP-binding protein FtsE [Coriobacteriales bacterium]|nr:cell division ATP-binding protein FtsE [Coriobacteriales bacterium]
MSTPNPVPSAAQTPAAPQPVVQAAAQPVTEPAKDTATDSAQELVPALKGEPVPALTAPRVQLASQAQPEAQVPQVTQVPKVPQVPKVTQVPKVAPLPETPPFVEPATRTAGRQVGGTVPVILFEGVSKAYPAQPSNPALNNVSLKIFAGEFIFLVGHSGSGKSTFIRLINREIVATKGRLTVAGEDVIRMRSWRVPYLRRNIGCVFQDFKLLPNKTAFENVAFALEVIGKSKHIVRTQVPEVLRLVGLEDKLDQYPDQLSGGEQQRVSIARAIVNRPPLLICDEPTGNLDPQTSLGIMRLLDRINRTGTTILVATHDREMVDSLRKRVVALENGYLVRDQDKGVYGIDA